MSETAPDRRERGRIMTGTDKKTCFVIQGFGEKTDFPTGRKLNLDASYQVIKEAIEEAGLRCIRADEIQHSGIIDEPMYEHLLRADLVIADLSTYNVNAAYELGVRYALRPYATIVVAEEGLQRPFDVSHMVIRHYKHLGEDIGAAEAKRFKRDLKQAALDIVAATKTDSPVYTFLKTLKPPVEGTLLTSLIKIGAAVGIGKADEMLDTPVDSSAKALLENARAAMAVDDFAEAKRLLGAILKIRPNDDYIRQQLALATYKSKQPDPESALIEAQMILGDLRPDVSNDPETLGLWGAVHKRLWEAKSERKDLDTSVDAYERGFHLKSDYYNGINLAFVLNIRAVEEDKDGQAAQAIADFVAARRVRAAVLATCRNASPKTDDEKYWLPATAWEAAVGLGEGPEAEKWEKEAKSAASKPWMYKTTTDQIAKLSALLATSPLRHLPQK